MKSKSDTLYVKIKLVLDTFIGPILPCYSVINNLKNELLAPIENKIGCTDRVITCPMKTLAVYQLENLLKTETVSNLMTKFSSKLVEKATVTVVYSSGKYHNFTFT